MAHSVWLPHEAPAHPSVLSENRAGDGEQGGWDLEMNAQPRAQASLGEGEATRSAARPPGAVCCDCLLRPGCESQAWQPAGLSGREEGGVALPPGAGSWDAHGSLVGLPQAAEGLLGFQAGLRCSGEPRCGPRFQEFRPQRPCGAGGFYHQGCPSLHPESERRGKPNPTRQGDTEKSMGGIPS